MSKGIFIKFEKYPNPADTFAFKLKNKKEAFKSCLFILDANVLILPYTANTESLNEIKKVYKHLTSEQRLFIPAQAAREYLDNRATKLSDAQELIHKKQNQNYQALNKHPLLEEPPEFKEAIKIEKQISDLLKLYRNQLTKVIDVIKTWGWDDPVSEMYHEVLSGTVLDDSSLDKAMLLEDLNRRSELKLPPGYKDGNKDLNQAGDLIIWHEILKLASEKQLDITFVSGDEKSDWWHQSGGKKLYPRFELVDEFRDKTGGKTFHIVSLSELLLMFNADSHVIEAVKSSEKLATNLESITEKTRLIHNTLNTARELRRYLEEHRHKQDEINLHPSQFDGSISPAMRVVFASEMNQINRDLLYNYSKIKIRVLKLIDELSENFPTVPFYTPGEQYHNPTAPVFVSELIEDFEAYVKACEAVLKAQQNT